MKFTSNKFVLLFSVLATLQIIAGAAALGDVIGDKPAGLFALTVGAVQAGATFYVNNQITPTNEVVAVATENGHAAVAGPAAHLETGTSVAVVAAGGLIPGTGQTYYE